MRRYFIWAAVVVGALYIISNVMLTYDANAEMHEDIADLEAKMEAEELALNEMIQKQRAENEQLKRTLNKLKQQDYTPLAFVNISQVNQSSSSFMCVSPYGTTFYPLLPYFYDPQVIPLFKEVAVFEKPLIGNMNRVMWGDLDGSKYPSLLIQNYSQSAAILNYNNSHYQQNFTFPVSAHYSCWGDYNNDGWEDVLLLENGTDRLYLNNQTKFQLQNISQFTPDYGPGIFCQFLDVNRDKYLDIIRVNQSGYLHIFKQVNNGFEDITKQIELPRIVKFVVGVAYFDRLRVFIIVSSIGLIEIYDMTELPFENITYKFEGISEVTDLVDVHVQDMNNDKYFDIIFLSARFPPIIAWYMGNFSFGMSQLKALPIESHGYYYALNVELAVADFNNDMLPDIFLLRKTTHANAPNMLYINEGEMKFEVMRDAEGATGTSLGHAHSVEVADFNFDGAVDIAISNGGGDPPFNFGPTQIFKNTPNQNNWIEIELIGTGDTMNGYGALVAVKANGVLQVQALNSKKRLHFGIGEASVVSKIMIYRPAYHGMQSYQGIQANQLVTLSDFVDQLPKNHRAKALMVQRGPHKLQCDEGTDRIIPSFFILGIWKAATKSLAVTLNLHPQIRQGVSLEYFYFSKYYDMPQEWYWGLFPCGNASYHVTFDSTAGYLYDPNVPERIKASHPQGKFIIMLRDPIARAYSHFYMSSNSDDLPQAFDARIRHEVSHYNVCVEKYGDEVCAAKGHWIFLTAGLYYYSIQRWFAHFKPEQFIFVHFADFVGDNRAKVVNDVQGFLGLEKVDLPSKSQNVSPDHPRILKSTEAMLKDFYKPYNQKLYDLLHVNYGWDT